ncbi:MAG: hypothetical protein H2B04_06465, partial [Nitrosopumilaceae archaeon]|nr:hypothetical protein [Nitrosopumilaceae archaeon]
MDSKIESDLISEIHLNPIQTKVYLLVTCYGKMSPQTISEKLKIPIDDAQTASK